MARPIFVTSDKTRVQANTSINIDFKIDAFYSSAINGTIILKIANSKDFNGATIITPTELLASDDGVNFTSYSNDNTIEEVDISKTFRLSFVFPNEEAIKYAKLCFTESGESQVIDSLPIILNALTSLDFKLAEPIPLGDAPIKIRIVTNDVKINASNLVIHVFVCNNALDASPTWEDASTEYANGTYHEFANTTKTADSWALNVRFYATKNSYDAGFEIKELYIAHE